MAKTRRQAEPKAVTNEPADALSRFVKQVMSESRGSGPGAPVTANSVRGLPAVWYSISKIAGNIGTLPLVLYNRPDEANARVAREHPAYWLMKRRPNDLMTPAVFKETLTHHALLHGNGRAAIVRNGRGEPDELIILAPLKWAVVVEGGRTVSGVRVPDRKWHVRVDDERVRVADRDCLHVMGLSDDGIAGLSLLDVARDVLGLGLAQQVRAVSTERNGAKVKFLLSAPVGAFRDEAQARQFIERFNSYHSDPDNADKAGLLREGVSVENISQTNEQAQAIQGRQFSRDDIALLFAVEQMLGSGKDGSYNSLEMRNRAYLTNCLDRWLTRWEEECTAKLLTTREVESEEWYFKFLTESMLRGTTKERYEVYQIARQIGVMSPNEIRELEDMNERTDDGGDSYDNPNTTSNAARALPAPPDAEDDTEDDMDEPAIAARLSKVVTARLQGMARTEAHRVCAAAEKESNFCNWVGDFYATWTDRVATAIAECDGDAALAQAWSDVSKSRLLDVAGRVDQSGLAEAVRGEVSLWNERAAQLASAVLAIGE